MSTTPYTLHLPDMQGARCRESIEEALEPLGASLAFDMDRRQITIAGIAPETALTALAQAGYPASPAES